MKKNKVFSVSIFIVTIFITCCANSKNTNDTLNAGDTLIVNPSYITDSINSYGYSIKKFGNDSIYGFADGHLRYILYLDTAVAINRILFRDGQKSLIDYNPSKSKSSIKEERFFTDINIVSKQVYMKDTIIFTANNPIQCTELAIEYHKNGKVAVSGYRGFFAAQGVPVGLITYYDSSGYLYRTKNYIYPKKGQPYIIVLEYYETGKLKSEKRYIYHLDGDDEATGIWKYYDENGKLIRTKNINRDGKITEQLN